MTNDHTPNTTNPAERFPPPEAETIDAPPQAHLTQDAADERTVHGLLTLLDHGGCSKVDTLITGGLAQVRSRARTHAAGERDASPRAVRRRIIRKSIATAVITIGVSAMALFILLQPTTTPAVAAIDELVEAIDELPARRYDIQIRRRPSAIGAERETRFRDGDARIVRGTLDIGPEGRYLLALQLTRRGDGPRIGFDGTEYWVVPMRGPIHVGPEPFNDPVTREYPIEAMMVDRVVARLQGNYKLEVGDITDATGEPLIQIKAVKRAQRRPGPDRVTLEARRSDRVVTYIQSLWKNQSQTRPRTESLTLRLAEGVVPDLARFSHAAHHDGSRMVTQPR